MLEKEIKEIVSEIIQVSVDDIESNDSFFDDYGMDSLKALEILAEIENKYHITINPEKLIDMTSVAEVVRITSEYLNHNHG
ncbi:acyl carrier protein [Vallitalea pronyensis]|uniref:Acyl carrier protein n=1 Tax=Vallitalea pronyensis TaxID=1348613 RepID=A0A8J8MHE2_9FIRM|nr:acyl carrier protein [Vallitalea pronyensis]QUI21857.1 acyl carrier protein [Vallitalea pronyensis]